jgi:hypothetical protein
VEIGALIENLEIYFANATYVSSVSARNVHCSSSRENLSERTIVLCDSSRRRSTLPLTGAEMLLRILDKVAAVSDKRQE